MQVIRGLHNLRAEHRGCVATIGNFDGVHLGHQAVFGHLREKALQFGLPATVITFEPQSQEFFTPGKAPARLTRMREKLHAIRNADIDRVVLLEFNHKLAAMSAELVRAAPAGGRSGSSLSVSWATIFALAEKGRAISNCCEEWVKNSCSKWRI